MVSLKKRPAAYTLTLALDARVALAHARVLSDRYFHQDHAEHLAFSCGYHTHPSHYVSPLIADDHRLFMAWVEGWNQREQESRTRTKAELQDCIVKISKDALSGTGQFFELYAQRFTNSASRWLSGLLPEEHPIAMELLNNFPYEPNPGGTWHYLQEDNDVEFVPDIEEASQHASP